MVGKRKAEISGTVRDIDLGSGKIVLERKGTHKLVEILVKDLGALAVLRPGITITVEAVRGLFGGWEAETPSLGR